MTVAPNTGSRMAFIGLGEMGKAMTRNLHRDGNLTSPLTLWNRTKSTADAHSADLGDCKVAETVQEAVESSDIIWSCLQDQSAVEQVFDSIFAASVNITGKLFVDSSTIAPEWSNATAKRVIEAGGEFVSMPVMGEPVVAAAKKLICIPSGKPESVDRIRPYLEGVVCRAIVDLSGEEPGTSSLLKLMGNFLIMTTMETVAEVNVFADKSGIGTKNMNKLMGAMFPNPPHAIYNHRMLTGEYYEGTPIVEVYKALALTGQVLDMARSCGASVPIYEVAREHLKLVQEHEGSKADITGIYGAVRVKSGLPYRNGAAEGSSNEK
ncbi:6-phosphogluconate dehydrogenase-like protein [Aspergillus indologenus CBS 114.80]|uniref:6-phosphogluconate dehydrogenase-like protein n=1 Tax=Aspergillus indologenus CBS 114.80 TaxID=1450541 RepID=A0A2V5I8A5_9EURO|nr:6-phosphogluconate dehydrogenase-like protein [Aspergillus indologenus CBS 114.80]